MDLLRSGCAGAENVRTLSTRARSYPFCSHRRPSLPGRCENSGDDRSGRAASELHPRSSRRSRSRGQLAGATATVVRRRGRRRNYRRGECHAARHGRRGRSPGSAHRPRQGHRRARHRFLHQLRVGQGARAHGQSARLGRVRLAGAPTSGAALRHRDKNVARGDRVLLRRPAAGVADRGLGLASVAAGRLPRGTGPVRRRSGGPVRRPGHPAAAELGRLPAHAVGGGVLAGPGRAAARSHPVPACGPGMDRRAACAVSDIPTQEHAPEQARRLRSALRRHAVDTRPLQILPYRRLLVGQGTAFIGSMLTQVAVPVQVYEISGSSLYVGLVGLAGLLPIVAFGLYGGAIADAVDRRVLYFWSSLATWAITLALLAQTLLGLQNVGLILGLVAVQSAAWAIASSTRGAIIPRIVTEDLVPAANTLSFTIGNVGQVIGPLLAGFLVTREHGFAYAYGLDAVLFTAALYSALRLPPIPPDGSAPKLGLRSVAEGLKFIATRPVLIMSFAVDIAAMVLAMPRALFPAAADARFHGQVGPLYAAIAIGAVVAGLSSGWIGRIRRQGVALTVAIVCWGGAVALSGMAHALWLAVGLLAVAGAADLVSAVYRQTILQTYAPDEMRGRMQGVFIAVVAGGPRLGDLRAGGTAAGTGTTFSWVAGGVACMVVVAIAGPLVRTFWRYDTRAARTEEVPA